MKRYISILAVLAALIILSGCNATISTGSPGSGGSSGSSTATSTTTQEPHWGVQTKTSGCTVRGPLQDTACTPGAIFPNVTKDDVC